jgi:hypothetical protein
MANDPGKTDTQERVEMTDRSTYHATCLCGQAVASHTRETLCSRCGRLLVFEWGKEPVIVKGSEDAAKAPQFPYTWWDCTCESDPLGKCVIPQHKQAKP